MRRSRSRSRLVWALALLWCLPMPAGAQMPPSIETMPLMTGQKISLDLKGVDILDVLKLLSQKSGLNFVAGRNVTGRVTIFAKDVDIWEAFERIVDANDLAYELRGQVINVMTARDYELLYGERFQERKESKVISLRFAKANQLATVLNQIKSTLGRVVVDETTNTLILNDIPPRIDEMTKLAIDLDRPTETRIYSLNYADAEKLKDKLQEFLTPGVGTFNFDQRTNKAVVTDLHTVMVKIDQVIKALDERESEVLIDARIVKVELTDKESFGVDWQRVFAGADLKTRGKFSVLSGDVLEGGTTGFAIKYIASPRTAAQVVLEALKTYGKVDTISNPRITVSNNQEARILVGKKEAFITVETVIPGTGPVQNSPKIEFVDVGTKLFVTPSIKRDGQVQMKIRPEVSTADVQSFDTGTSKNRIPIVSTTEAETNVLVTSGSTLIIGGLIESKTQVDRNQVPVLGDLPFIGAAFRSTVTTKTKTELVVFLTPQIITPSGEHVTDFAEQPEDVVAKVTQPVEFSEEYVPAQYQTAIRELLYTFLTKEFRKAQLGPGSLVVTFVLGHDGRLVGLPEIISSQGPAFVEAANAAMDAAQPFPPFPEGSRATQVRFRIAVDYRPGA